MKNMEMRKCYENVTSMVSVGSPDKVILNPPGLIKLPPNISLWEYLKNNVYLNKNSNHEAMEENELEGEDQTLFTQSSAF